MDKGAACNSIILREYASYIGRMVTVIWCQSNSKHHPRTTQVLSKVLPYIQANSEDLKETWPRTTSSIDRTETLIRAARPSRDNKIHSNALLTCAFGVQLVVSQNDREALSLSK